MTLKHHSRVRPDEWPFKYFTPAEIACKGTGLVNLSFEARDALTRLDGLRARMGHALIVTSGYRSPAHNKRVGGARASKHMEGIAFDVSMANVDPHQFETQAEAAGFTGIGLYPPQKPSGAKNFIHIDTRKGAPWRGAQWGEFPKRATRFAPEPVAEPVRDAARDAAPLVGVGGGVAVLIAEVDEAAREVVPWLPEDVQRWVFIALAVAAAGVALHRFMSKRNAGE